MWTFCERLAAVVGTGFGVGLCPYAPGTMGALLALVIWAIVGAVMPHSLLLLTGVLILLFLCLGIWSGSVMERRWGTDPSRVVVDEMVGVWIPLLSVGSVFFDGDLCTRNIILALLAFLLFRFFDIVKPLGIQRMERMQGGWGIMLDDVLAGVYSLVIIVVVQCWI
ncbi:MAG: phosphatidylglycerophosphatase A [Prevotella sp.]|nr:phosphatidylglycerophosphatase A [Candidatus Equicola faecalis]